MNWKNKSISFLDLNETEVGILDAISTPKNPVDIAKDTKIPRTSVAFVMKKLVKKGLARTIPRGKRALYVALTESELSHRLASVMGEMRSTASERKGAQVRISKENEFTIHVGVKEIIPAYSRIAATNKNERIQGLQHHRSYKEITEKASSKLLAEFNDAVIKNDIIIEGILNESAYDEYAKELITDPRKFKDSVESLGGRMADYYVFPDASFNFDAELWIFKATALIINWHEEVAIEITNIAMTGFLRNMFEFVKIGSRKIDHNKMLEEALERARKTT